MGPAALTQAASVGDIQSALPCAGPTLLLASSPSAASTPGVSGGSAAAGELPGWSWPRQLPFPLHPIASHPLASHPIPSYLISSLAFGSLVFPTHLPLVCSMEPTVCVPSLLLHRLVPPRRPSPPSWLLCLLISISSERLHAPLPEDFRR